MRARDTIEPNEKHRDLPGTPATTPSHRLDRFRYASGATPTAALRLRMQKVMQDYCAVFRTGEVLEEGHERITRSGGRPTTSG